MERDREERLEMEIRGQLSSVCFSEEQADRILEKVHQEMRARSPYERAPLEENEQDPLLFVGEGTGHEGGLMRERSKRMRHNKKRTGLVLAAALIVMGTVTAIAAGKVAYTSSSTSADERIDTMAELLPQAKASLGQGVKIPERYANGSAFKYGYLIDVEAFDDAHNAIGSFPEASVSYAGPGNVSLSISKPLERTEKKGRYDLTETYQDIQIQGKTDQYLFLPPDQEPSEADKKLEEEGKLMISYGSSEVERKAFHSVQWREGDLEYLLFTFEDVTLGDLAAMAKETIDLGR